MSEQPQVMDTSVLSVAAQRHFWSKVITDPGCWWWTGAISSDGYGRWWAPRPHRRHWLVHRLAYELLVGPIPDETPHLDHLCRNRWCCNPAHLEPVTQAENNRRAESYWRNLTHCIHDHEFTPENTRIARHNGQRVCVSCEAERSRRRRAAGRRLVHLAPSTAMGIVLESLVWHGLTLDELCSRHSFNRSHVDEVRGRLRRLGLVAPIGARRPVPAVWTATPAGVSAYRAMAGVLT